jgi:hypothetical protein
MVAFRHDRPHMDSMANWQKSTTRQAPMTKAELRLMLTEAVRNTQSDDESPQLSGTAVADPAPGITAPVR